MASRDAQQPNVLFILSDDQGAWAMRCAGNDDIITPALDAIAATGLRFTDFFCTSPVCSPARASLLTGEIPSRHGVHDWIRGGNVGTQGVDYLAGQTLLTDLAVSAGYRCALVGKWHLGASDVPRPGHVRWYAHQSGMSPYYDAPMLDERRPVTVPRYLTDDLTEHALAFLGQEAARDEPFWLALNYTAPHYPWIGSHPQEYTAMYRDCAFASCPQAAPHPFTAHGNPATDEGFLHPRESLTGYFAATTAMDAGIGRVLAALDGLGLTSSTLVIFMSDNGMNCGHHGIWGKGNGTRPQNMYDSSVKVPCLMAQPGRIAPGVCDALLSAYDVFPTLVDYLGLDDSSRRARPGRSFRTRLDQGGALKEREIVVYDEYGPVRMVRTREWKYVHRYPDGPHELFDLVHDPGERANLLEQASAEATVLAMRDRLDAWFARFADPAMDGSAKGVTGCGQLGRIPPNGDAAGLFAADPIKALEVPAQT
ncbi:MAG: sulfatase-like hydrolase/transferase [Casimicrobiaceae bacterium]